MNKWIENNIMWIRNFEFVCHWIQLPLTFEVFTIELDKYHGHICILNFAVYWYSEGEYIR